MTRATRAEINLAALKHNLQVARDATPNARQMAIIKANGYGHGLVEVARALRRADAFGVATLDEAINLREGGIYHPIVLLEGFTRESELPFIHAYDLECVIHHESQLAILEKHKAKPMNAWLKIDTGMHRLGFDVAQAGVVYERLMACESVNKPIRLMTHLANADDRNDPTTEQQCQQFMSVVQPLGQVETTIGNSAGILAWPDSHAHWVRPGIMLYGVSPFKDSLAEQHKLQSVMTLKSELIGVKPVKKGERVGYGGTYTCNADMTIGVVAIGYGDGYPRHAGSGTPVLVNDTRVPLIGRVSMDMITIDLTAAPSASVGDSVTLWGEGLPVETIASHANTIGYELLCGVTQRVNYHYLD